MIKKINENIERWMIVFLFSIIIAIMIINALMRYILQNAIPWASDAVLFLFVWMVWFTISYGFKKDSHVKVTVLTSMLPEKIKFILSIFVNIVMLIGFSVLLIYGIKLLTHFSVVGKTGLLIKYPMWSLYLSTPVGLILSIIRIVQNTKLKLKKGGK